MSGRNSATYNLCKDLENWMTNLPDALKQIPIKNLAIPGSHDSFTSSIKRTADISPDAGETLQRLNFLGPLFRLFIRRWVRTQAYDALGQLNVGIRYFDLRISTKKGTEQLYFVHGLYADKIETVFKDLKEFLDAHPKELVILDCQHFYECDLNDHRKYMELIRTNFQSKLVPVMTSMEFLTLNYTQENNYQVIIIYRWAGLNDDEKFFWPGWKFPNPWPETTKENQLIEFLNEELKNRCDSKALVTQFLLTPTTKSIFRQFYSNLKYSCVYPLQKVKYKWLGEQSPKDSLNIVIADFIDLNYAKFPKVVISLNEVYLI